VKEAVVSTPAAAPATPVPGAIMPGATLPPARLFSSLGAPVPAWLVVFACGLGMALGYCFARLP
jgi:hypothetical protein